MAASSNSMSLTMYKKLMQWKSKGVRRKKKTPAGLDVTVAIEDYSASTPNEVSVQRGMQVEIIDASPGQVDWCLVRTLPPDGADSSQGLVPIGVLKPLTYMPGARNSIDLDDSFNPEGTSSPVSKRRSSFKKWLTTPVRKLSHGRIEKHGGVLLDPQRALQRPDRRTILTPLGADQDGDSTPTGDQAVAIAIAPQGAMVSQKTPLSSTNEEEEPATDIEMPPPMEIQDHSFKPDSKEVSTDDVTAKLASQLSLKPGGEGSSPASQLASQIENFNMAKLRNEASNASDSVSPKMENSVSEGDVGGEAKEGGEEEEDKGEADVVDAEAEKAKYLNKRQFVVKELFETENVYVQDLSTVVDGYMSFMKENPLPEDMEGKDKIVFGNIHQIYCWHKETMLAELQKCLANPSRVGSIFIRYERRLDMYVKYCQNKPKSEYIMSEYDTFFDEVRQKLGHRLTLQDLLIKPVQRIMRYQLLLKDILKYTEKAQEDSSELKKALRVMRVVPKAANDMMQVGRLQGFNGQITAQGKLLLQSTLLVAEMTPAAQQKFKERRVFLFEQIIIFSEMIESKKDNFANPTYIFKNSLKVNKMSLSDMEKEDPLKFMLTDRTPGSDIRLMVQCNSEENKDTWIKQIRSILDMQGDFLRALQSPIAYQKELTKELSAPEFSSPWSESAAIRKTQSHPVNRDAHNLSPVKTPAAKNSTDSLPAKSKPDRCKSVPGPVNELIGMAQRGAAAQHGKASCPSSPTTDSGSGHNLASSSSHSRKSSGGLRNVASSDVSDGGSSSPKPKRTIFEGFRNTLGRKSKSTESAPVSKSADTTPTSALSPQSPHSHSTSGSLVGQDNVSSSATVPLVGPTSVNEDPARGAKNKTDSGLDEAAAAASATSAAASAVSPSQQPPPSSSSPSSSSSSHVPGGPGGNCQLTSGRILFDYQAIKEDEVTVSKGEIVQILSTNQNTFLIHRPANHVSPAAEGWVPSHIIGPQDGDSLKRAPRQMFKIKKPMFRPSNSDVNRSLDGMSSLERKRSLDRDAKPKDVGFEMPPIVQQPLTSLIVQAGDTATLTCRICGRPRPSVGWRYQDSQVITVSPRVMMLYNDEGQATLQLSNVSSTDSGEYSCFAASDVGSVVTRATLTVLDRPSAPGQPMIRNQVGTAVHLEWAPPANANTQGGTATVMTGVTPIQIQGYTIEFREAGASSWQLAIPYVPNTSQVIGDLEPGLTYQFRVSANNAIGISEPSRPSNYVAIPSEYELSEREDSLCIMWKATLDNDFTDMGEIGKGRFSVVHRCIQRCSGQELAAKFITKRLVRKEAVEIEFNTLQSLQHTQLAKVFDLYETPTSFVIIMQLLNQGRLLESICSRPHFDELMAAEYISQMLDCLQYLHNCRIAHLDVKPENLMIEQAPTASVVKLVDFGDARHIYNNYYIHPMIGHPEFTSPEVVSGTPVGLHTDVWSVGVFLYVLLSGVSPFLDESLEETCSNIVRNDFCFPDEYFAGISPDAKDLVRMMLVEEQSKRPTAQACLDSSWIKKISVSRSSPFRPKPINTSRLSDFIQRRKHQSDAFILKSLP